MSITFGEAFGYSPFTGNKLEEKNGTWVDTVTGQTHYLNPKPCVNVLVGNATSEVLLVKRAGDPHKGTWDIPGGFMKTDETLEECAVREMKEELGVLVTNLRYLGSWVEKYEYEGVDYSLVVIEMLGNLEGEPGEAQDDISEWKWFNKADIPWDQFAWKSIGEAVTKFFEVAS